MALREQPLNPLRQGRLHIYCSSESFLHLYSVILWFGYLTGKRIMSDKDDERKELQPDEDEERLRPKRTRTKGGLKGKLMFLGIGLIAGVVLGVLGLRFLQNYNPPDKPDTLSPSVVFSRIVAQNEMVSVSQDYNIVDKVTDNLNYRC